MGSKGVALFIILLINQVASYPQKPLPKDYFPENVSKNEMGIKQNRRMIDHRLGNGSANGGKGGNNGGGSRSLHVQGKANFIPIYAAGAARRRHRNGHRSLASCLRSSAGLSSVAGAATLASLLYFYMVI